MFSKCIQFETIPVYLCVFDNTTDFHRRKIGLYILNFTVLAQNGGPVSSLRHERLVHEFLPRTVQVVAESLDRGVLFGILFDFFQIPERLFHAVHVAGHEFGDFCEKRGNVRYGCIKSSGFIGFRVFFY